MKELVDYIVKQLVENKDDVVVDVKDTTILVELDKSDMGKVIGKQGKIIKAIRSIVRAAGFKEDKKYSIEVVERKEV